MEMSSGLEQFLAVTDGVERRRTRADATDAQILEAAVTRDRRR